VLVDEWRAIGIEATIRNVPTSTLTAGWQAGGIRKIGDFDALLANAGLGIGSVDPQSYLSQRHRCAAIPSATNNGAGANYERFCDPQVEALLDDAGGTVDMAKRAADYRQVLGLLNDKAIAIWLYVRGRYDAFRARVGGYRSNGWDVVTWNAQDWFVRG
jgi:peptide/nickel transport system substrate-binding protein